MDYQKIRINCTEQTAEYLPFVLENLPFEVWDSLALMLLGLALFKWGFLTGSWSKKDYWTVVKIAAAE